MSGARPVFWAMHVSDALSMLHGKVCAFWALCARQCKHDGGKGLGQNSLESLQCSSENLGVERLH
eukprot:scaffold217553_cov16-Tisochrysis_lutea.AAC.2